MNAERTLGGGGRTIRVILSSTLFCAFLMGCAERTPPPRTCYLASHEVPILAGISASGTWPDECSGLPGYPRFRAQLTEAVAQRDAAALRALFASNGRMRFEGLGISNPSEWIAAGGLWSELEEILALGCEDRGDRLFLPFITKYSESGEVSEGGVIALVPTDIHSGPSASAPVLMHVPRGALLTDATPVESGEWHRLSLPNGTPGFVRTDQIRSPYDTVVELVHEDGAWRIMWLGGNA